MNKQVIEVYDRMAMPDGCAKRIERELNRAIRQKKGGKRMTNEKKSSRKQGWCVAAVLVCLVLVLSVGGVFFFLRVSGSDTTPTMPEKTEQPATQGTLAAREEADADSFALTEDGKAFLEKMCYYMPDWSGDDSLNDTFWRDFLFNSFTCPEITDSGATMTVCGEQELVTTSWGQAVKVSREDGAVPYIRLALGRELPDFAPSAQDMSAGQTPFYYEDGSYFIGLSDFGDVGYAFRGCYPNEQSPNGNASVIFDAYSGTPEDIIGSICFTIVPERNENGFIITQRSSDFGG